MAIVRYAGFGEEADNAHGTPVAATFYLPVIKESVEPTLGLVPEPTITARGIKEMIKGIQRGKGDLQVNVYPDKFPTLLRWALGAVATTGAAAPYTHKISVADALIKSFTLRVGYDDYERIISCCQIDDLELAMSVRAVLLKATVGIIGGAETKGSIGTPTPIPSEALFTFGDTVTASIAGETGKAALIENLVVKLANGIGDRETHEGLTAKRVGTGEVVVTGSIGLLFTNTDEYDRFLAGADFALQWKIARGAYPSLQIDLPKIYYEKGSAHIANREERKIECNFRAAYKVISTIDTPILITVMNSEATV